jgi:hypothetical protein
MYASIRRGKANPGATAEIARRVTEEFIPVISQVPGFVAYYAVDLGEDNLATVSIFTDKAGAEESGRRAADWVKQNLGPLMAGPLEIMVGEVVVHKAA